MQQQTCRVLHAQLGLLLTADADSTALGQLFEPRVASLPVAVQKDLILVAHTLFHSSPEPLQASINRRSLLTQLLHVLSKSTATAVADSACWALHQQQQHQLSSLQATSLSQRPNIPAASLPSWLVPSSHQCCSWLEHQQTSQAAPGLQHKQPSVISPLVKQQASAPTDASKPPPACVPSGADPEKQAACIAVLPHDSSTPYDEQQLITDADAAGVDPERRPEKRVRLDVAAAQADTAGDLPTSSTWSTTLQQLQVVVDGGDVKHGRWWTVVDGGDVLQVVVDGGDVQHLDLKAFADTLAAAAALNRGRESGSADGSKVVLPHEQRMQLQQLLQALPLDACHVLIEELLQQCSAGSSNSSSSCPPDSSAGGLQLPDALWAMLLAHALLPHLQQLKGAASNTLLKCLTELGRSSRCDVLVPSVLQPLVLSQHLNPVQVQLLVKLARDVASLQTRILELVLMAAGSMDALQQPRLWELPHAVLPSATTISSHECFWRDPHAQLLKSLLELAPQAVAQRLPAVIAALTAAVQQPGMATSTVFGQLLVALVKQLSVSFSRNHVQQLQAVVARTSTFLSKTVTIRLQQLEGLHDAELMCGGGHY